MNAIDLTEAEYVERCCAVNRRSDAASIEYYTQRYAEIRAADEERKATLQRRVLATKRREAQSKLDAALVERIRAPRA